MGGGFLRGLPERGGLLASVGMLRRLTAAAVVAFALLAPASPALASAADVLVDCNDNGRLTKEYSQKEYRQALAQMPADIKQYTDCESIIRRAQLGLPATEGNSGSPFVSASPEEEKQARDDITTASRSGAKPQRVGAVTVTPGALSYTKVSAATSELPTPMLVLLSLIVLATLGAVANHVISRRRERAGRYGA